MLDTRPAPRVAELARAHDFVPSGRFTGAGTPESRRRELCAVCGGVRRWAAHHGGARKPIDSVRYAQRAYGLDTVPAPILPRSAPASAPHPAPAQPTPTPAPPRVPWQLPALAHMLGEVAVLPLGLETRRALDELRQLIRYEMAPSTKPSAPSIVTGEAPQQAPATIRRLAILDDSRGADTPEPAKVRPVGLSPAQQRIAKGFRSDQLRRLYRRAVEQGYTPSVTGNGHVRLVGPAGASQTFVLSLTSDGISHHYRNSRADARRAGVDVSGL